LLSSALVLYLATAGLLYLRSNVCHGNGSFTWCREANIAELPVLKHGALARVAEILPRAPLTRNQVELMQIDTTASESLPGFRALGISPRSLEDELKEIFRQNKPRV
jgi:hypothetical protein